MEIVRGDDPRYQVDEAGAWWYHPRRGNQQRARAYLFPACPGCGRPFLSMDRAARFCSHGCVARSMHASRPVTTPKGRADGFLVNSDNPRYSCDGNGQWWYTPGGPKVHSRTRAYIKQCTECGSNYLANIFHRKTTNFCSRPCAARAWTREHPGAFSGERAANWRGGRTVGADGYVRIWNPEAARRISPNSKRVYVLEHRLVMEQVLGRHLERHEQVHHKNGDRTDNRPENLELWAHQQPSGQRPHEQKHCPTCTCAD